MARRKKQRRKSPKTISIYDSAVAWGNLTILTEGSLGTGPIGFLTGDFDLAASKSSVSAWETGLGTIDTLSGADQISARDLLNQPGMAFAQIQSNVKTNAMGMAFSAIVFNAGAKVLKRTMRQPINQANRLIRPLGLGVRI